MHCGKYIAPALTRRDLLRRCANGFGAVALTSLLNDRAYGATAAPVTGIASTTRNPMQPKPTHFAPKAKSVIFLYMDGGPSQVDTFDYKPMLEKYNGQDPRKAIGKLENTQFNNIGSVLKSPWDFKKYGQSGHMISDLFPYVAKHADDLAVIKSMVSLFPEHTAANYFLHTGSGIQGRPSMGAWIGYGLGSVNQNLPGFIVLNGGLIPPGGLDNFNSGFLPAAYQGSVFKAGSNPVANINPTEASDKLQRSKLDLLRSLDQNTLARTGSDDGIESAIANYEMAYRMQGAVPELMDIADETQATQEAYGLEAKHKATQTFGRQCLIARRLVERGVRFIELTCPGGAGDRWDQHNNLKEGHEKNALAVDQPIGALIGDLKARGLLDSTLIVWAGEFGRTPFAQGGNGRDHNPYAFSLWMAGGGVKGGASHGESDAFGYKVVSGKVEIHDLHATMLHQLGVEHTKSTFRFSGRDMRLTDVHGHVVKEILA